MANTTSASAMRALVETSAVPPGPREQQAVRVEAATSSGRRQKGCEGGDPLKEDLRFAQRVV